MAVNDLMALGLMAGLRAAGMQVPKDVSVVGIDGLFLSSISNPTLTTVQLPVTEMARAMVDRVMSRHADQQQAGQEMVFPVGQLIERESVAPPPAMRTKATSGKQRQKEKK